MSRAVVAISSLAALLACSCGRQPTGGAPPAKPHGPAVSMDDAGARLDARGMGQIGALRWGRAGGWIPVATLGRVKVAMYAKDRYGERMVSASAPVGYVVQGTSLDCRHHTFRFDGGASAATDAALPDPNRPVSGTFFIVPVFEVMRLCMVTRQPSAVPVTSAVRAIRAMDASKRYPAIAAPRPPVSAGRRLSPATAT